MSNKARNQFVDIMRGVAMLLVVLGHTITGCTDGAEHSFIYNIIWSLQMPMFILISGYVTKYGGAIKNFNEFAKYLAKRTFSYIFPFLVWSFLIRGLLCGNRNFLNVNWLLWNMDSGYWFLVTIWTISIAYGFSIFMGEIIVKKTGVIRQSVVLAFYSLSMCCLIGLGLILGFSFFAIKLTLYYMPFYFIGYLYGQYRDKLFEIKLCKRIIEVIVALCLIIWLIILQKFNLFSINDSGFSIVIRVIASLSGCIAVFGLSKGLYTYSASEKQIICSFFKWIGSNSLDVYVTHYLFLNLIVLTVSPLLVSVRGVLLSIGNFGITVLLTSLCVFLLNSNNVLSNALYGHKTKI